MNWEDHYEARREELANPYGITSQLTVNAYAELDKFGCVEVIGECGREYHNGRVFIEDMGIVAVRTDPGGDLIDLADLSEDDESDLLAALETAAEEWES
jgi:hypothetical protein